MIPANIQTYRQDRPSVFLKEHPQEHWRCDIYPSDGSGHHGVGETEAEAVSLLSVPAKQDVG